MFKSWLNKYDLNIAIGYLSSPDGLGRVYHIACTQWAVWGWMVVTDPGRMITKGQQEEALVVWCWVDNLTLIKAEQVITDYYIWNTILKAFTNAGWKTWSHSVVILVVSGRLSLSTLLCSRLWACLTITNRVLHCEYWSHTSWSYSLCS